MSAEFGENVKLSREAWESLTEAQRHGGGEAAKEVSREGAKARSAAEVTRPVMRYYGGKWRLAPWVIEHLPPHRVYVEPFGGAASVLLRKERSYAEVYNDLDGEVVNLFRVVRDRGAELVRAIEMTPFARDEFLGAYFPGDCPVERARCLLIRSFMGYGADGCCGRYRTGFRSDSNKSGTTPAHDWRHLPESLVKVVDRLRGVVIENREASAVVLKHDGQQVLHYVDPPYVHETRQRVRGYRHEMTDLQHTELAEVLHSLSGLVVISGYACPLYDGLYATWECRRRKAYADGARVREECLWLNPAAVAAQRQGELSFGNE